MIFIYFIYLFIIIIIIIILFMIFIYLFLYCYYMVYLFHLNNMNMFMFFKTNFYYFSLFYLGVLFPLHSHCIQNYQGAMLRACPSYNSHRRGVGYDD